jgi:hypothetical protein
MSTEEVKTLVASNTAIEINKLHKELLDLRETALEKAIRIGELLIANKKAVPHGAWLKWIDKNLEFGSGMAERYMRIFDNKDELQNRLPKTDLVTITDAYLLLAKKSDHEPARAESEQPAAVATDSESKPADAEPEQKPRRKTRFIRSVHVDRNEPESLVNLIDQLAAADSACCLQHHKSAGKLNQRESY